MGKTVYVPHFNRDTVECASRERDKSNPGIKTKLSFVKNKRERFREFQDLIVALDACYCLHKVISISLLRFGDDRCDLRRRFPASQKILCIVCFICIFFISE